jgi:periplasmic copper chaperone A
MKRTFLLTFFAIVLAVHLAAAQKALSASKAWVKAPSAGETSAKAFVLIDNPTMYDVYVVSAQSDAAASVTFQKGSDAKPETVPNITAPAYDSVELKPDGVHMLLTGLKKPLKPGDKVTIVLATDSGITIEATADVK